MEGDHFSSCGQIPLTNRSIKDVPNSNGTARRVTTTNQALKRKSPNRTWSSITPSIRTDCFVAAFKPGSIVARTRSVHVVGILYLRIRLGPTPLSRTAFIACITCAFSPIFKLTLEFLFLKSETDLYCANSTVSEYGSLEGFVYSGLLSSMTFSFLSSLSCTTLRFSFSTRSSSWTLGTEFFGFAIVS